MAGKDNNYIMFCSKVGEIAEDLGYLEKMLLKMAINLDPDLMGFEGVFRDLLSQARLATICVLSILPSFSMGRSLTICYQCKRFSFKLLQAQNKTQC